jgi:hypothetical protein
MSQQKWTCVPITQILVLRERLHAPTESYLDNCEPSGVFQTAQFLAWLRLTAVIKKTPSGEQRPIEMVRVPDETAVTPVAKR